MNKYKLDTSKPIRLFECFSGIGTQAMAFDRLALDYEVVGISEIDKFALLSYASIHTDYLKIRETYFEDKQLSKEYMIDVLQSKNVGYDFKKGKHSIYSRTGIETVKDYYLADLLTKNYGDISLIKGSDLPKDIDMLTYSYPCTDLSNAGKQAGLVGTRSGLVYEVFRILIELEHINNKPKTLIMENVVALIQKKFIKDFENMQDDLVKLGYTNSVMRMNARDYGVAQRRDRVFMVSTITNEYVETPKPFELELRLGDYLESEVDEKYILSEKAINWLSTDHPTFKRKDKFLKNQKDRYGDHVANTITTRESNDVDSTYIKETNDTICLNSKVNGKQPSLQDRVYSSKGVMPAITTSFHPSILEPTIVAQRGRYNEKGELEQKLEVGEVGEDGISNTLTTVQKDSYVLESSNEIIRKLTPKECWRLMGIDDSNFEKAEQVMSNAQLYKQAGNAIVVDVFAAILKEML